MEYAHPTNWTDDKADVLINVLADIDGELNVPFDIKFDPDGGCDPGP